MATLNNSKTVKAVFDKLSASAQILTANDLLLDALEVLRVERIGENLAFKCAQPVDPSEVYPDLLANLVRAGVTEEDKILKMVSSSIADYLTKAPKSFNLALDFDPKKLSNQESADVCAKALNLMFSELLDVTITKPEDRAESERFTELYYSALFRFYQKMRKYLQ